MAFSISMLKPVGSLAQQYGWKGCVYGGPGTGKTPFMMTAPSAVHCFVEPGLASVRSVLDQPGYLFTTPEDVEDYVKWFTTSTEANQFWTGTFDSYSAIAQMKLDWLLQGKSKGGNKVHGKQAYGEMGEWMMTKIIGPLFTVKNKHVLGICQQILSEVEGEGQRYRPSFPGKMLDSAIPHLFDSFWRLERTNVLDAKGVSSLQRVVRTAENFQCFARERTGKLAEIETPDLNYLINKALAG